MSLRAVHRDKPLVNSLCNFPDWREIEAFFAVAAHVFFISTLGLGCVSWNALEISWVVCRWPRSRLRHYKQKKTK